ncbi:helix-turn-helix domain-containing protein [Corallococcus sp. AB032C]|uniref:helix-turn-helix domain-containing protein n=1 Tax=Corallococcus TaxID=83461 RepID=UPI000EBFF00E|nr:MULTISPECIES: helix-turn-helix domain-containing protein [Corallococcus]NPC48275.1 helix-turn-helix domain-containing protein [Corallococcus exiguus]RKH76678.1 helix-turn-helix domain-containing protein [Corallococcus sp. AB032C]
MRPYPVHTPEQLGAILKGYRREQDMTQGDLAHRTGLAQSAISFAETHPERIGVERLFRILAGLNVELVLHDRRSRPPSSEW